MEFKRLAELERNDYLEFHEKIYREDLDEAASTKNPRWKTVAGYYAMHGITKLFLGKKFNVKIRPPGTHMETIEALRIFLKDEETKRKILSLLKKAEDFILSFRDMDDSLLPDLLNEARIKRVKSQYYVNRLSLDYLKQVNAEAEGFIREIVLPYVKIIEEMLK